jgi:outer membrane scaffolding protein for murein synthesis (MipA/OmpV family)
MPLPSAIATLPACLLIFATPALAQDGTPPDPNVQRDFVAVGAGVAVLPDYEGSNDYRVAPVPGAIGSIGGYKFMLLGNRVNVDLIKDKPGPGWDIQAGPFASIGFNRTSLKGIDDPRIKALGKVDNAIELGGYIGIGKQGVITSDYDRLSLTLSYRHDVNNAYDGAILTPSISYLTPLSTKTMVTIFANANHADSGYATTYYSITPQQSARSGLAQFNAKPGWKDVSLGAAANFSLTGDLTHGLSVAAGLVYTRMINDFAASPVVSVAGSRDQMIGGIGLAYTF